VYRDALVAARVVARGIPTMRVVRVRAPPFRRARRQRRRRRATSAAAERRLTSDEYEFSPRQFEYSRHDASMLLCGTNTGEIVLFDRERDELRGVVASGEHDQILGLSVALGARARVDVCRRLEQRPPARCTTRKVLQEELRAARRAVAWHVPTEACRLELPPFRRLTSVAAAPTTGTCSTSGYSTSVSLVDLVHRPADGVLSATCTTTTST
jgi:hypothetical protein